MDDVEAALAEHGAWRGRASRERLLSLLPPRGSPGRTAYSKPGDGPPSLLTLNDSVSAATRLWESSETGAAVFETADRTVLVLPPFAVETSFESGMIDLDPLVALLERRRVYAAFLLRRGGYTIGFFRDSYLVDSKTDRRFVKNRHRKGGQSQRRFDRIREKQIDELFAKACGDTKATLTPYVDEIETLYLGGDRQALIAFRKQCADFDRVFGPRVRERRLNIPGEPRKVLLNAVPREVWSSDVWILKRTGVSGEEGRAKRPGS